MCGISGFIGDGCKSDILAMVGALKHRGPDGNGHYSDKDVSLFLGHTRLSIVDLKNGAQPMSIDNGEFVIVYNGEIYNQLELRHELELLGHRFFSKNSDTEVVLRGWKQWRHGLLEKLNGMFAFAVYDKTRKSLALARDRFGEKPLFWARQNGRFLFSSEIKGIVESRFFDKRINRLSLKKYFAYGYVPAPGCLFDDCFKLSPGHVLDLDIESGIINESSFWEYRIKPEFEGRKESDLEEEIRALVEDASKKRMLSDVPIGVFLSGGLDSTIVLSCMANSGVTQPLNSYSIGFDRLSFDESDYAKAAAAFFGANFNHRIFSIEDTGRHVTQRLSLLDEPISDPSFLPTNMLCEFASEQVKVALTGDGADELFGGYDPFKAIFPAQLLTHLSSFGVRKKILSLVELLPVSGRNMSLDFKLKRFFTGLTLPPSCWSPGWMAPFTAADIRDLFDEPVEIEDLYADAMTIWESNPSLSLLDRSLEFFVRFYLPNNILTKVDRAGMLAGIETRAVFLDPKIAEFSSKLPSRYKLRFGKQKRILQRAFRDKLPTFVLRRKKKGFGIPLLDAIERLNKTRFESGFEFLNYSALNSIIGDHYNGKRDNRIGVWSVIAASSSLGVNLE